MPNPTLTPTITALARELAGRVRVSEGGCWAANQSVTCKCIYCHATQLLSALASPPVEAAQETVTFWTREGDADRVLKSIVRFVGHGFKAPGQASYAVTITVSPAAPEARR